MWTWNIRKSSILFAVSTAFWMEQQYHLRLHEISLKDFPVLRWLEAWETWKMYLWLTCYLHSKGRLKRILKNENHISETPLVQGEIIGIIIFLMKWDGFYQSLIIDVIVPFYTISIWDASQYGIIDPLLLPLYGSAFLR